MELLLELHVKIVNACLGRKAGDGRRPSQCTRAPQRLYSSVALARLALWVFLMVIAELVKAEPNPVAHSIEGQDLVSAASWPYFMMFWAWSNHSRTAAKNSSLSVSCLSSAAITVRPS